MLQSGTTLGNYKILAKLGEGGMADVYEAEDVKLGRRVALKVLPPEFGRKADLVTRFEKEVRAAASLNHHAIVTVFEVGQENGVHFFSMRLLKGGDLRGRIQRGMTEQEALVVLRQLADAFAHAHGRGFVHRDVKPENIMFDEQGNPVLTDFGIAKAMDSGTRVTATGVSIGTPRYISPEQARGKPVDARADLYSLGVILFEMLTGRPPYDGEESLAVIFKHVTEPIPRLPDDKAHLQSLVDRLMAKEPGQRPESATALIGLVDELMPRAPGAARTMLNPVLGTQQNPIVANLDTGAGPALRTDERQHANALIEEHQRQQKALERRHRKDAAPAPEQAGQKPVPSQPPPAPPPTPAQMAAERERRQREAELLRQAREQAADAQAAAAAEAATPPSGGAWKIALAAAFIVVAIGLAFLFRDRLVPAREAPALTDAPVQAPAPIVETTTPPVDPAAEEKARQAAAEQERLRAEEEARQKLAAEEAAKKTAAEESAKKAADEQRRRAELQRQQRQAAAEAERQRQAAEAARLKAAADEAAQAKAQAEEEARKRAAAEAEVRRLQEAEAAAKKKAEEQERQRAEEEETRRIIEEEIGRLRRQEEEARRRAQADAEARRKAQEQGGTTP